MADPQFWTERYATEEFIFGRAPSQFVVRTAPLLAPGSEILCIADGEGRNSVHLASLGHRVTANDFAANAVEKAKALAAQAGVAVMFSVVDLETFAWPEAAFDAVYGVFFQFAPPPFRDQIFAGLKRAVRPGGLVLVHGYTPKQLEYGTGGPPCLDQLYTVDVLRDRFGDLDLIELRDYDMDLDEGSRHKGRSALVDLVARRR